MPVFLIVSEKDSPDLHAEIERVFPDKSFALSGDQWLVDAEETTKDMHKELGIGEGRYGRVVVFKIDGYSGYHRKSLWEWLQLD